MDASTAAATRVKLNADPPPEEPGAESGRASSGFRAAAFSGENTSRPERWATTAPPPPPPRPGPGPGRGPGPAPGPLAPGDGVAEERAAAARNFFGACSGDSPPPGWFASSSDPDPPDPPDPPFRSRLVPGRPPFAPAPRGDGGGDMSRSASAPRAAAAAADAFWNVAGLAMASLTRIGTSASGPPPLDAAAAPGEERERERDPPPPAGDRGAGERSSSSSASTHGGHANVAASMTRVHRNRRAIARDARAANGCARAPLVDDGAFEGPAPLVSRSEGEVGGVEVGGVAAASASSSSLEKHSAPSARVPARRRPRASRRRPSRRSRRGPP